MIYLETPREFEWELHQTKIEDAYTVYLWYSNDFNVYKFASYLPEPGFGVCCSAFYRVLVDLSTWPKQHDLLTFTYSVLINNKDHIDLNMLCTFCVCAWG